ncbi:MAG TPA: exosortase A [Rubrivivax sp.]|nr:exosortase A [Rubrivivax sp.]
MRAELSWRVALPTVVLVLLAIGVAFRDTVLVMTGIWWRSDTFAHCMLVLPISLWLVWRKRDRLAALNPSPQPWMLLAMVVTAGAWLLAELAVVNAAAQFAFVTMLILAVPAVLGIAVARAIMFPLLFLYFAVPFGEFMLPAMMEWTADFTVAALRLSGIPVFREGQNFAIPSGNWSVIDECSGVRYVMASFLVGSLFAYLNYRSYLKRAVFMGVSLLLPVVANWIRAYMIVMLAHLSGNRIAVGVDHILYGWVFFGLIVFAMFMIGMRWADADAAREAGSPAPPGIGSAAATRTVATGVAAVVIGIAPHLAVAAMERAEASAGPVTLELPARLGPAWQADDAGPIEYRSQVLNPSAEAWRTYAGPAGKVGLQLAYFRHQSTERKLVSSQHQLTSMRDERWSLPTYQDRELRLGDRELAMRSANVLERAQGLQRKQLVIWRLYWIDGQFVASDVRAKWAGMVSRLSGAGDEGALLTVYAEQAAPGEAEARLERFLNDNASELNTLLSRVQRTR